MKKIYITTPLYYVNSTLTVGGAYTTIMADILARYHRYCGKEVFFLTGSDEHGEKILKEAKSLKKTPKELADEIVGKFKELWQKLEITNDDFIRTTDHRHERVVQKVFNQLKEKGFIYKGNYEGLYCIPCESFLLESQLDENKKCPHCHRSVDKIKEENYFFKLSQFQKQLEEMIKTHSHQFVLPDFRRKEVENRILEGMRDVSISRSVEWGIPIEGEKNQFLWVWFDALINYISAIGYSEDETKFYSCWPADIHFIGKDILWFHSVLWPAILLALGLPVPKTIFGHGWWTFGGEKISKSKGHRADPNEIIDQFGADSLRYFLAREIQLGSDGEFSLEALQTRFNNDLANDLGNLLSRSLSMLKKYREGKVPEPGLIGNLEKEVIQLIEESIEFFHQAMPQGDYFNALKTIWAAVQRVNKFIEEKMPWKLAKDPKLEKELDVTLAILCASLKIFAYLLAPIIPSSAQKILDQLALKKSFKPGCYATELRWSFLPKGHAIADQIYPLFPKIESFN